MHGSAPFQRHNYGLIHVRIHLVRFL